MCPAPCGTWMTVLPDSDGGAALAAPLLATADHVVRHASGRPWLVGRWPEDELLVVSAGTTRLAVFGRRGADETTLPPAVDRLRSVAEVDGVARRLSGCVHLLASVGGQVRVQGSVAQARRVFFLQRDGVTVAADRADVLAHHFAADIDDALLAARLLFPLAPPPLAGRPVWRGIEAVPGDHYLRLDPRRGAELVRWWRPPAPELTIADAAPLARAALRAAVAARTDGGRPITADLSGGLDSTGLCFLAAERGTPLVTLRHEGLDPDNHDGTWARRAAAVLPAVRHEVLDPAELPGKYAGISEPHAVAEEPFAWVRSRADLVHGARRSVATGARLHLGGHGGDEVFTVPPSALHTLIRTRPVRAVGQLRRRRALRRWRTGAAVRSLLDGRDYRTWVRCGASSLQGAAPDRTTPYLSWGAPCRLPDWAGPRAVALVRDLLLDTADDVEALDPLRAHHQILEHAAIGGRAVGQAARLFTSVGTTVEAPYLDDRVLEVALATRLDQRGDPRRYKPLLTAALTGVVPDTLLTRTTKGEFGAEVYRGLRRHRDELYGLGTDSLLAERGLVDPDGLRRAVTATHPTGGPLWLLDMTVACETWLRDLDAASDRPHRSTPDPRPKESSCP